MMIVSVLLYLSCVILSFASSVVSPLERNFSQKQPEHHQVVESVADKFLKRNHLFSERLPISKTERDWLEAFIVKLHHLAATLQRNVTSVNESHYRPVELPSDSPTHLISRKQKQSIEITSKIPEDDELVRELESLHQAPQKSNKPSITQEVAEIENKKEILVDEVAELRNWAQNDKKSIKLNGPLVHKFERLRDDESVQRERNVPKVNYLNASASLVTPRMDNTLLVMPRVLRKHFRYGWHKDPGNRHYPFNHAAIANTIQKLHQNYLIRNEVEQGRAHQIGMSPFQLKSFYMPYPMSQQKNETSTSSPLSTDFSEEVKRQLRDGKVVILSDSVVRSNFTS